MKLIIYMYLFLEFVMYKVMGKVNHKDYIVKDLFILDYLSSTFVDKFAVLSRKFGMILISDSDNYFCLTKFFGSAVIW